MYDYVAHMHRAILALCMLTTIVGCKKDIQTPSASLTAYTPTKNGTNNSSKKTDDRSQESTSVDQWQETVTYSCGPDGCTKSTQDTNCEVSNHPGSTTEVKETDTCTHTIVKDKDGHIISESYACSPGKPLKPSIGSFSITADSLGEHGKGFRFTEYTFVDSSITKESMSAELKNTHDKETLKNTFLIQYNFKTKAFTLKGEIIGKLPPDDWDVKHLFDANYEVTEDDCDIELVDLPVPQIELSFKCVDQEQDFQGNWILAMKNKIDA